MRFLRASDGARADERGQPQAYAARTAAKSSGRTLAKAAKTAQLPATAPRNLYVPAGNEPFRPLLPQVRFCSRG